MNRVRTRWLCPMSVWLFEQGIYFVTFEFIEFVSNYSVGTGRNMEIKVYLYVYIYIVIYNVSFELITKANIQFEGELYLCEKPFHC